MAFSLKSIFTRAGPASVMNPPENHRHMKRGMMRFPFMSYNSSASTSEKFEPIFDYGPNTDSVETPTIRAKSRRYKALYSFYAQGISQLVSHVIGTGIVPLFTDSTQEDLWTDLVKEADITGAFDLYALQARTVDEMVTAGDAFIIKIDNTEEYLAGRSKTPLKLKLIESDQVPHGYTFGGVQGNRVIDGIEVDPVGRIVAYHIYPAHPKDFNLGAVSIMPVRHDAENVLHFFRPHRIGALRGKPWAGAALPILEFIRRYMLNEAEKKARQSKDTIYYTRPAGEESLFDDEETIANFVNPPTGAAVEVPEGYDVKFPQMPATDTNFTAYIRTGFVELAVSLGISVELLTFELGEVNDRVMRVQLMEMQKFFEHIGFAYVVPRWQDILETYFKSLISLGAWEPSPGVTLRKAINPEWMMPSRGHIQPVQEVDAIKIAVDNGFMSHRQAVSQVGYNLHEVNRQNSADGFTPSAFKVETVMESGRNPALDMIDDYGIAVRAGLITPQLEDEIAMRKALGLPDVSDAVRETWNAIGGTKTPITLSKPQDSAGAVVDPSIAAENDVAAADAAFQDQSAA